MSLTELNFELKRARFWVIENSIKDSINLIEKMEEKRNKIFKEKLS